MAHSRYSAGLRAVERLLGDGEVEIRRLLVDRRLASERIAALKVLAEQRGVSVEPAARRRLDDLAAGARHQGVIAELRGAATLDEAGLRSLVEQLLTDDAEPLLLVLDSVQDPHNLGACLRTADAAGAHAVVIPRARAAGITPAVRKVASGAAEALPIARVPSLARVLDWLAGYGVRRVGTADIAGDSLYDADLAGPLALVVGNEERGLAPAIAARCDALVSLPMAGRVESLNLSVAAGVCLYEILRRRITGRGPSQTGH